VRDAPCAVSPVQGTGRTTYSRYARVPSRTLTEAPTRLPDPKGPYKLLKCAGCIALEAAYQAYHFMLKTSFSLKQINNEYP
jgi:hypothetical protein